MVELDRRELLVLMLRWDSEREVEGRRVLVAVVEGVWMVLDIFAGRKLGMRRES